MDEFEGCPIPDLATQAQIAEGAGLDPAQVRHFSRRAGVEPTHRFGSVLVYNRLGQRQILAAVARASHATRRGPKMSVGHVWALLQSYDSALDALADRLEAEEKALVAAGLREPAENDEDEEGEQESSAARWFRKAGV